MKRWVLFAVIDLAESSDSIPWREAFPEFKGNEAGTLLSGYRHREGLTQMQLAETTGIPQRHISEMERGKRIVGKATPGTTLYNFSPDKMKYENVWVALDKETIWDYPKDFKAAVESGYPYQTDISTFSDLIRQYIDTQLDQLLINSFEQDTWGLTDVLRAADRRLGRERLREWGETLPPDAPARKILAARFG